MNIGEFIYHHRTIKRMTQEELATDICTTSYLSKIENSRTDASDEVISLLLSKLDVRWEEQPEENIQECNKLLHSWYRLIKCRDKERSKELLEHLSTEIENINDPHTYNTYQLFRLRYFLLLDNLDTSKTIIATLEKHKKLFSLEQEFYWNQFLGLYESMNQQFNQALIYYRTAEKQMTQLNLIDADFLYQISYVHSRTFQVASTIVYATQALEAFYKEANLLKCINCHVILGINFARIKGFNKALEHYQSALSLSEAINRQEIIETIYHNLGDLYSNMGEHVHAIEYFSHCLKLIDSFDSRSLAITIYHLIKEYLFVNDTQNADKWLIEGMKIVEPQDITDLYYKFMVLQYKMNHIETKNFISLLENEIIPYFKSKDNEPYLAEIAKIASDYYVEKFQYKKAYQYLYMQKESLEKIM